MKNLLLLIVPVSLLLLLSGCGTKDLDAALEAGARKLGHSDLHKLLSGSVVEKKGYGIVAKITYRDDGKLSATNNKGESDKGVWEVNDDDQLCTQFRMWGDKETACYQVYQDGNTYKQFNSKGMKVYTFTILEQGSGGIVEGITLMDQSTAANSKKQINRAISGQIKPLAMKVSPKAASDIQYIIRETAKNCPGCNFADADFSGVNLMGANLEGANLSGADLSNALLKRANLRGANFHKANLKGANLKGADLTGANFKDADLTDALLGGAIGAPQR